ncbi:MAG: hypothetical protein MUC51_00070 [Anaerolineae bacterium]|nr:hypothetical protein [Anaerolineae bacterium]
MNLPEPLAIVLIVAAALLPGSLIVSLWGKPLREDPVAFLFAGLSFGLLAFGWLALTLAELGGFSLTLLAALWLGITTGAVIVWLRRTRHRVMPLPMPAAHRREQRWELAALGLWLLLVTGIYFRPHEFIIGGADAGVYASLGANIVRTGSIRFVDPVLAALDPALYDGLLRTLPTSEGAPYYLLPGFYVPAAAPAGDITPQFYHLHPVWFAVGYALAGLRGELWLTPLWGILGCLAVYMTARQLWGWKVGLLALAGLSATALQIWFARYPTAEVLTQYLFWTGIWAFTAWLEKREPPALWAALAGVAFGEVFLTRIDAYVLLIVPILLAVWLWQTPAARRGARWFYVPLLLLAAQSLLHGWLLSRPYFATQIRFGQIVMRQGLALPVIAVVFLAVVAGFLMAQPARRGRALHWLRVARPILLWTAAVGVVSLALYAYFLRPIIEPAQAYPYWYGGGELRSLDQENFVRLGWYLSPLGVALGVLGAGRLLVRQADRRTALLLGTGLFFSAFFLWRISANPHQVYAMRRYVPYVLPFFILCAAYLLGWLYRVLPGKTRWLSVGLTALWLVGIVFSARGFVGQVDYRGLIAQFDRLSAAFEPSSVLIFNDPAPVGIGDFVGTPLRFLYGQTVFTLRNPKALDAARFEETVRRWNAEGHAVYWIAVEGGFPWPSPALPLLPAEAHQLSGQMLENTYDHKPQRLNDFVWRFSVARVGAEVRQ